MRRGGRRRRRRRWGGERRGGGGGGEGGEGGGGGKKGGLERVVFCVFEAKDERAYGEWLPYVLSIQRFPRMEGEAEQKKSDPSFLSSKIFPPTPDELPTQEDPAESEVREEASAVSTDTTAREPQSKKRKTSTEDLDNDDWETVEKPDKATSDEPTDVSEEGGKAQAGELRGSDGEKIEKPVEERQKGESEAGAVQPENMLAKDW